MSEYIERGALMQAITAFFEPVNTAEQALMLNHTLKAINLFPAADVVEVKNGRWLKEIDSWRSRECSVCRAVYSWDKTPPYCPNCGAKMDGKGEGK